MRPVVATWSDWLDFTSFILEMAHLINIRTGFLHETSDMNVNQECCFKYEQRKLSTYVVRIRSHTLHITYMESCFKVT